MAPRKRAVKKKAPVKSPEEELIRLYGREDNSHDRVNVYDNYIEVDDDQISTIDEAEDSMRSCCGVLELSGVSDIAPGTPAGFAAVDALYTQQWKDNGYASVVATVSTTGQKNALAYFRATAWKEIPLGNNKGGTPLVMFLKVLRP